MLIAILFKLSIIFLEFIQQEIELNVYTDQYYWIQIL